MKKYINEHLELKKQVKITLVADFDPFQAGSMTADKDIKTMQFTHKGNLADQKQKGDVEYYEDPKQSSHSILSFFNDISKLQEGTYTWNAQTQQWVRQ